jgi:hypothetical protein
MVSIATLGVIMMGGMGIGIFTNAGLSNGEIKEKCKTLNDLEKEFDKVKQQTDVILTGFHKNHDDMVRIVNDTKSSVNTLVDKILEMKKANRNRLHREEYIYFVMILTIIIILVVKAVLSIFFKENIK